MTDAELIRNACNAENNPELPEGCMHPWCLCNRYPESSMTPPREAPDQDIVERLNAKAKEIDISVNSNPAFDEVALMHEAAAEIVRLRSERQDISRLREALEALLDDAITREAWLGDPNARVALVDCTCPYCKARAALSETADPRGK